MLAWISYRGGGGSLFHLFLFFVVCLFSAVLTFYDSVFFYQKAQFRDIAWL